MKTLIAALLISSALLVGCATGPSAFQYHLPPDRPRTKGDWAYEMDRAAREKQYYEWYTPKSRQYPRGTLRCWGVVTDGRCSGLLERVR